VLEIGCGWGGFAEYAAKERGARVTGLTISREQHDFARRACSKAGLGDRVEIVLRDYRDERGSYDGVASIEMFEAVGEKYWPVYFDTVRDRLKPGRAGDDPGHHHAGPLFPTAIADGGLHPEVHLPGGMLPSPGALRARSRARG
jgi:cyclopropane-fatty-acyl-phospholipid synthase